MGAVRAVPAMELLTLLDRQPPAEPEYLVRASMLLAPTRPDLASSALGLATAGFSGDRPPRAGLLVLTLCACPSLEAPDAGRSRRVERVISAELRRWAAR